MNTETNPFVSFDHGSLCIVVPSNNTKEAEKLQLQLLPKENIDYTKYDSLSCFKVPEPTTKKQLTNKKNTLRNFPEVHRKIVEQNQLINSYLSHRYEENYIKHFKELEEMVQEISSICQRIKSIMDRITLQIQPYDLYQNNLKEIQEYHIQLEEKNCILQKKILQLTSRPN